jgi:hypothetical protein
MILERFACIVLVEYAEILIIEKGKQLFKYWYPDQNINFYGHFYGANLL